MIAATLDSWLASLTSNDERKQRAVSAIGFRYVATSAGDIRVYDSGGEGPCILFVPDEPNVIEHYQQVVEQLSAQHRVVVFDMPGFGFSLPSSGYKHRLSQGADTVLAVMDALGIERGTLAFSCINGLYAYQAALQAPDRISGLFLSQTPAPKKFIGWGKNNVPKAFLIPVLGQVTGWVLRKRAARVWYGRALPHASSNEPVFRETAKQALDNGACFCLSSVCQGTTRDILFGLRPQDDFKLPTVIVWGTKDRSHHQSATSSFQTLAPHAEIIRFEDCGHFPDVEQPQRYAALLSEKAMLWSALTS